MPREVPTIAKAAVLMGLGLFAASCDRSPRVNPDGSTTAQGIVMPSAHVVFSHERKEALLDWLAAGLPKRIQFPVSRTEWKGFTTIVPQLRVETKPVPLTIQIDEDQSYVPEEIRDLADHFRPVLDQQTHSALARAASRIEVASATSVKPAVSGKPLVVTTVTDLDPRAAEVDQVLTALSELTNGFTIDLVNLAVRVPGSKGWISR